MNLPEADLEKVAATAARVGTPKVMRGLVDDVNDLRTSVMEVLELKLDLLWYPYRKFSQTFCPRAKVWQVDHSVGTKSSAAELICL